MKRNEETSSILVENIVNFSNILIDPIFLRHCIFLCLSVTIFLPKNLPFENKALVGYRSTSHRVEVDDLDEFFANYFSFHREKNFF